MIIYILNKIRNYSRIQLIIFLHVSFEVKADFKQEFWWKNNQIVKHNYEKLSNESQFFNELLFVPTKHEQSINSIDFDCSNKPTGPNKNSLYCDIYHACVFGNLKKTYSCPHYGERFYYDERTQKCQFSRKNRTACLTGNYYAPLIENLNQNNNLFIPNNKAENENNNYQNTKYYFKELNSISYRIENRKSDLKSLHSWVQYVRDNQFFSCSNKSDGFYSSKWCNVYYRCLNKKKFEFFCPKMQSGGRLWWIQHSSSEWISESQAQCQWPCETKRPCTSSGGILIDDNFMTESYEKAEKISQSCLKFKNQNQSKNINLTEVKPNNLSQSKKLKEKTDKIPDFFRNRGIELNFFSEKRTVYNRFKNINSKKIIKNEYRENICQNTGNGTFVSNPVYCNLFHVCFNNLRKDFLCSKGLNSYDLWWNDITKQCEWPCKIKCNKKIFGSKNSAFEIENLDRNINPLLCNEDQYLN